MFSVRPNITSITGNQTSNETGDMTLSCHATGKPTPNITWSKQGNKEWNHTGTLLPLKNISRDQHGDYWCTAENNAGHVSASVTVTVNCKYRYTVWHQICRENYFVSCDSKGTGFAGRSLYAPVAG